VRVRVREGGEAREEGAPARLESIPDQGAIEVVCSTASLDVAAPLRRGARGSGAIASHVRGNSPPLPLLMRARCVHILP
jgi:hypothetical protein